MNLSTLKPAKGACKDRKRVGRGPGSGHQKTSGRGHKGQKSNAGFSRKWGYEGGQMPLNRRVPKRGFTNIFGTDYAEVNLDRLSTVGKAEVGVQDLVEARIIKSAKARVKILGRGEISSAVIVRAHKFSAAAKTKIEAAGGQAILVEA